MKKIVFLMPLLLVIGLSQTACSPLMFRLKTPSTSTPTIATTGNKRPLVCNTAWKKISYSAKLDSAQTVLEIRQNNAAQAAYCGD